MDKAKVKEAAASYARSFIAAMLALYMAGIQDPKVLLHAGIAAVAPVILRAINPKDKSFGVTGE
jgi:hypothetical protein